MSSCLNSLDNTPVVHALVDRIYLDVSVADQTLFQYLLPTLHFLYIGYGERDGCQRYMLTIKLYCAGLVADL